MCYWNDFNMDELTKFILGGGVGALEHPGRVCALWWTGTQLRMYPSLVPYAPPHTKLRGWVIGIWKYLYFFPSSAKQMALFTVRLRVILTQNLLLANICKNILQTSATTPKLWSGLKWAGQTCNPKNSDSSVLLTLHRMDTHMINAENSASNNCTPFGNNVSFHLIMFRYHKVKTGHSRECYFSSCHFRLCHFRLTGVDFDLVHNNNKINSIWLKNSLVLVSFWYICFHSSLCRAWMNIKVTLYINNCYQC